MHKCGGRYTEKRQAAQGHLDLLLWKESREPWKSFSRDSGRTGPDRRRIEKLAVRLMGCMGSKRKD